MATYTKETALYDTGAISEDIQDAGTKATNYIAADSSGIMVYDGSNGAQTPSAATTKNVFIDADSMDVRNGTDVLATFGADSSRIGGENSARLLLEPSMMSLVSDEDINFFSIDSDVGTAQIKVDVKHAIGRSTFTNGRKLSIYLMDDFATATTVRIKGSVEWELTDLVDTSHPPQDVSASVKSQSSKLGFYNMHRSYSNAKGYMKVATSFSAVVNTDESTNALSEILTRVKIGNSDSGWRDAATLKLGLVYSENAKRIDLTATAEASSTKVYQNNKGTKVDRSSVYHIKTAHGPAYSLGTRLGEAQLFSTTIGEGLTSNSNDQLCTGKYNNVDGIDDCAFVVGNGTSDTARSNALTVDWSGNVDIAEGASYKVGGVAMTDYIVEQGTDGMWTYRKWASGIAECWGYTTAMTTNCNTAYGYQYYGALATQAFPAGLFAQRPTLSVSCDGGDGLWVGTSAIQSNTFTYYPYCGKNGSHTYALSMHAIGRWK